MVPSCPRLSYQYFLAVVHFELLFTGRVPLFCLLFSSLNSYALLVYLTIYVFALGLCVMMVLRIPTLRVQLQTPRTTVCVSREKIVLDVWLFEFCKSSFQVPLITRKDSPVRKGWRLAMRATPTCPLGLCPFCRIQAPCITFLNLSFHTTGNIRGVSLFPPHPFIFSCLVLSRLKPNTFNPMYLWDYYALGMSCSENFPPVF